MAARARVESITIGALEALRTAGALAEVHSAHGHPTVVPARDVAVFTAGTAMVGHEGRAEHSLGDYGTKARE